MQEFTIINIDIEYLSTAFTQNQDEINCENK